VIEERNGAEKVARLAQRYTEIFSDDEEEPAAQPAKSEQAAEIVDKAKQAAKQRDLDLEEIDRQRREEGLI